MCIWFKSYVYLWCQYSLSVQQESLSLTCERLFIRPIESWSHLPSESVQIHSWHTFSRTVCIDAWSAKITFVKNTSGELTLITDFNILICTVFGFNGRTFFNCIVCRYVHIFCILFLIYLVFYIRTALCCKIVTRGRLLHFNCCMSWAGEQSVHY